MKMLKRLQKLRCKGNKCKKVRFFDYFELHVAILNETAFFSANNPIRQRNHSWMNVFNVLIHEIFRNLTKVS